MTDIEVIEPFFQVELVKFQTNSLNASLIIQQYNNQQDQHVELKSPSTHRNLAAQQYYNNQTVNPHRFSTQKNLSIEGKNSQQSYLKRRSRQLISPGVQREYSEMDIYLKQTYEKYRIYELVQSFVKMEDQLISRSQFKKSKNQRYQQNFHFQKVQGFSEIGQIQNFEFDNYEEAIILQFLSNAKNYFTPKNNHTSFSQNQNLSLNQDNSSISIESQNPYKQHEELLLTICQLRAKVFCLQKQLRKYEQNQHIYQNSSWLNFKIQSLETIKILDQSIPYQQKRLKLISNVSNCFIDGKCEELETGQIDDQDAKVHLQQKNFKHEQNKNSICNNSGKKHQKYFIFLASKSMNLSIHSLELFYQIFKQNLQLQKKVFSLNKSFLKPSMNIISEVFIEDQLQTNTQNLTPKNKVNSKLSNTSGIIQEKYKQQGYTIQAKFQQKSESKKLDLAKSSFKINKLALPQLNDQNDKQNDINAGNKFNTQQKACNIVKNQKKSLKKKLQQSIKPENGQIINVKKSEKEQIKNQKKLYANLNVLEKKYSKKIVKINIKQEQLKYILEDIKNRLKENMDNQKQQLRLIHDNSLKNKKINHTEQVNQLYRFYGELKKIFRFYYQIFNDHSAENRKVIAKK